MNSYTIYTLISSTMRGFACFKRFCKIQVYEPKSQDSKIFLKTRGSKKIAKEAQSDPTQSKSADQNAAGETLASGHHGLTVVTTKGLGGYHDQTVVDTMAVEAPGCFNFFAAFRFPSPFFFSFCCYLAMYLAVKGDIFHSSITLLIYLLALV